jgi:hypothetical protein
MKQHPTLHQPIARHGAFATSLSLIMTSRIFARVAFSTLLLSTLLLSPALSQAQTRTAGQMVVPPGWENRDSIRFSFWAGFDGGPFNDSPYVNAEMDTLMANSVAEFGMPPYSYTPIGLRANGTITSYAYGPLNSLKSVKQRVFYAEPQQDDALNGWIITDHGYFWRYIDSTAKYYNNEYDANDISPYMEFPASSDSVRQTFTSSRYGSSQTLCFGLEGKTVLGYNDARQALSTLPHPSGFSNLLGTYASYPFGSRWRADSTKHIDTVHMDTTWTHDTVVLSDTARNFATILEFNIDTSNILMDSSRGLPRDSVPLVRLQITYKNAPLPFGTSVLPYVPFKTLTNPSAPGWYLALDTIITLAVYRTLADDWRSPDVLNGNSSTPSHKWKFKQLHVLLHPDADMQTIMASSITNYTKADYGEAEPASILTPGARQDEIVNCDSTTAGLSNIPLIEMEVLSTFRSIIRVRSLCWQDTVADRYFYRKRTSTVNTHSLNVNGSTGGYDDSILHQLHLIDSLTPPGITRAFLVDDYTDQTYLSASAIGLWDFLCQRYNRFYVHVHEQDGGGWAEQFRRERMSHNSVPPAMFENEATFFYGPFRYTDVFPLDYIYGGWHDSVSFSTPWTDSSDIVGSLSIGRVDNTSDSLRAYRTYMQNNDGLSSRTFLPHSRQMALNAKNHPKTKRFAIEQGMQDWGLKSSDTSKPYPTYDQRPTTPEETICQTFCYIANGVTSLNNAQAVDGPISRFDFGPGLLCPSDPYSPPYPGGADIKFTHDYNWGHHRCIWDSSIPVDSDGVPYSWYFGYSNNFRATVAVLKRINQIYPVLKRLNWINAYSTHLSSDISNSDSLVKKSAFLKIISTQPVDRWHRGAGNSYIDSTGHLDTCTRTFVEVGLFDDSSGVDHAALVVNTRMWPSLMDSSDIAYYNSGLPAKDQCHTTLGDIDVRKVFMKVDPLGLDSLSRSPYYLVKDLWKPDSSWLVAADSVFSFYLKPGDAKFLYISPVRSWVTGRTSKMGMAYNNGHRLAELTDTTRMMTWESNGNVQVAYINNPNPYEPTETNYFNADSVKTIEASGVAQNPSIAAKGDTAVVIYNLSTVTQHGGRPIVFAQSVRPFTTWSYDTLAWVHPGTGVLASHIPTPTASPCHDGFVCAWSTPDSEAVIQIMRTPGHKITKQYHFMAQPGLSLDASFITVATRDEYPYDTTKERIHVAWQEATDTASSHIYYRRFDHLISSHLGAVLDTTFITERVSKYGGSCKNYHPNIAISNRYATGTYSGVRNGEPLVTWEKVEPTTYCDSTFGAVYAGEVYVMLRGRDSLSPSIWSQFYAFYPKVNNLPLPLVHLGYADYPLLLAEDTAGFRPSPEEVLGLVFQDTLLGQIHVERKWVGLPKGSSDPWIHSRLIEYGQTPSLSLQYEPNIYEVMRTFTFRDTLSDTNHLFGARITDRPYGIEQLIPTEKHESFEAKDTLSCEHNLRFSVGGGSVGPPIAVEPFDPQGNPSMDSTARQAITWQFHDLASSPAGPLIPSTGDWPITEDSIRTNNFTVDTGYTIEMPAWFTIEDTGSMVAMLDHTGGMVSIQLELKDSATASVAARMDSIVVTTNSHALSVPSFLRGDFKYINNYFVLFNPCLPVVRNPYTFHTSTPPPPWRGYMTIKITKDSLTPLALYQTQTVVDDFNFGTTEDSTPTVYKRTAATSPAVQQLLKLTVHPNPFNQQTYIDVSGSSGPPTTITVYDIMGRTVQKLYDDLMPMDEALHFTFNGSGLTSGTYFVRVTSGNQVLTRRIQLMK